MPRWPSAYGPLGLPVEIVRSTERARRAPTVRASERQTRSDLICDRKTSCPPASSPPLATPIRPRCALPTCSSSSSSPLSFVVVHEPPPHALNLSPSANYPRSRLRYRSLHLDFVLPHLRSRLILSAFAPFSPLIIRIDSFDSARLTRSNLALCASLDSPGHILLRILLTSLIPCHGLSTIFLPAFSG
ncbi:hypothetical protein X777_00456 [Ooceraea biroi]|uniref:Uncharacterized protein n=1 Tax=Ooceraea biroi TaxID=2015173 RepID=A0A026WTN2_OOCBI|nr:hypothetical protein X777_00456 [Ooceraea biroi]